MKWDTRFGAYSHLRLCSREPAVVTVQTCGANKSVFTAFCLFVSGLITRGQLFPVICACYFLLPSSLAAFLIHCLLYLPPDISCNQPAIGLAIQHLLCYNCCVENWLKSTHQQSLTFVWFSPQNGAGSHRPWVWWLFFKNSESLNRLINYEMENSFKMFPETSLERP